MQLTSTHVVVYIYNVAVILSAVWVSQTYNVEQGWMLFAVAGLLGLAWTVYFHYSMMPRLQATPEAEESEPDREEEPVRNM